jgi:hypothetical protein
MHVPAKHHYEELHSVPHFVRITLAKGKRNWEPTFLVKSSTLTLKYLSRLASTRFLAFISPSGFLMYGLRVFDHAKHPAFIWSVAKRADELRALKALAAGECGYFFLFNEVAVNVAWASWIADGDRATLSRLCSVAKLAVVDPPAEEMGEFIDGFFAGTTSDVLSYESPEFGLLAWTEVRATYITNSLGTSDLTLFSDDEGGQQEELCHWLTDTIQPQGVWRSPQLVTKSKTRELTDFLLSHSYGALLIESKALALLQRNPLPDRTWLTGDVIKHINKAAKQLTGALV